MNSVALAEFAEVLQLLLFFMLLILQFYLLAKLFSSIDSAIFSSYKFLGPFALFIPGVLRPEGSRFFGAFIIITTLLFVLGVYLFEFEGLVVVKTP